MRRAAVAAAVLVLGAGLAGCAGGADSAAGAAKKPRADIEIAAGEPSVSPSDLLVDSASPRSVGILNSLPADGVWLQVTEIDGYDWDDHRPDREAPEGFQWAFLGPGGQVTRQLTKKPFATGAPFRLAFDVDHRDGKPAVRVGSVELQTKTDYGNRLPTGAYNWGGWGLRNGSDRCETDTVVSGAYTFVVACQGAYGAPSTLVTIKKTPGT